jgi:hypothetical protein
MKFLNRKTFNVVSLIAFTFTTNVSASLLTFNDETLWSEAIGSEELIIEDFESYSVDESFVGSSTSTPNGFSVTHNGSRDFRNLIEVVPTVFNDGNGTNGLSLFVNYDGVDTIDFTFDSPLHAFAFDASSAAGSEGVVVELFNSSMTSLGSTILTNGIDDFFGFVVDGKDDIASATFSANILADGDGGEGFYLDRILTQRVSPTVEASSPATIGTLVLALLLLSFRRYTAK